MSFFSFLLFPPPPSSTLFPYTTLFRSTVSSDSTLPRFQMSPDSAEGIPVMPPWSSVETHGGRGHHTLSRPGPPPGSIRRTRHRLDAVRSVVHDENTICHLPRSEEHTSELQSRGHLVC